MLRYCDPQSGEVLEEVLFPVLNVTCAAFGGDDLKDLYCYHREHRYAYGSVSARRLCIQNQDGGSGMPSAGSAKNKRRKLYYESIGIDRI